MIKKIKQLFETQTSLIMKKAGVFREEKIECVIDEDVVDCKELEAPLFECGTSEYTQGYGWFGGHKTVPAPDILTDDPWFEDAVISDMNKDYMELEHEAFKAEAHKFYGTKEPENIHQLMYEIATKNCNHTTAVWYDVGNVGGSENVL